MALDTTARAADVAKFGVATRTLCYCGVTLRNYLAVYWSAANTLKMSTMQATQEFNRNLERDRRNRSGTNLSGMVALLTQGPRSVWMM